MENTTKVSFDKPLEIGGMSIYDINKDMMAKEPPINKRQYKNKLEEIKEWFKTDYYMLLCHEERDYTLFDIKENFEEAKNGLKDCIDNRGRIIAIDYVKETDAYEIWILKDGINACCYYLFNYNIGVIVC